MRILLFPVLLLLAPVALAQSDDKVPAHSGPSWNNPLAATQPRDFGKLAPDWHLTEPGFVHRRLQDLTPTDSEFDAKMIVHPPKESLGEQRPGALVAENVYPGLEFLPITVPTGGKALPIPMTWPELKVENIPTGSPKRAVVPVQRLAPSPASQK